jgi:murein DD-endopeptidase MepM/ murein hydrolase activator NlpD
MFQKKNLYTAAALALVFASLVLLLPINRASAADANSSAGQVVTASGNLNVRSAADAGAPLLTRLPNGTYVTLISKSDSWWRVEYAAGTYGYASTDYIRQITGTPMVTSANLNVRGGPSTSYGILGFLPAGKTIVVLSTANNWSTILYDGVKTGYASAAYLKPLTASASEMLWPVPASHRINQYFGTHKGIDIGASARDVMGVSVAGDSIVAAHGGKVVYAGWLSGYGYVVYINAIINGQPIQTRYAHLSGAPLVTTGQTVEKGFKIGSMGSTGTSSGVHLHFEVRIRNSYADCIANIESTPVDPLGYVK